MYNEKIYLTPQEILNHEFKIDARGYRPQEVDRYLDMVIRDYTEYKNIIKKLEQDIKFLNEDNLKLKQELERLSLKNEELMNVEPSAITNVDLLRRISNLEKEVYNEKR
jgi:DivIVA domain-containing protein